jgi:hypothetical protein
MFTFGREEGNAFCCFTMQKMSAANQIGEIASS